MKKKLYFIGICLIFLTSCGRKYEEVEKELVATYPGEWKCEATIWASGNGQMVSVSNGHRIKNEFNISLSLEWKELIELKFENEFSIDALTVTGTSKVLNKGQYVKFYYRPICREYIITKITYTNENKKEELERENVKFIDIEGGQWGWEVYNEEDVIIESSLVVLESTSLENVVEKYVKRAVVEEISLEELKGLSDEELCYIRNGILAYCGYIYSDDKFGAFFRRYAWYEPIYDSTTVWEHVNSKQNATIDNIKIIERER